MYLRNTYILLLLPSYHTHACIYNTCTKHTNIQWRDQVFASDDDEGTFGMVEYELISGHMGAFEISRNTGVVTTQGQLDYEETPQYNIQIQATDSAENEEDRRYVEMLLLYTLDTHYKSHILKYSCQW